MRKLCAIFVGRIDILRAVGNLAVNGRTLFAPTKKHIRVPFFYLLPHTCMGAAQFLCRGRRPRRPTTSAFTNFVVQMSAVNGRTLFAPTKNISVFRFLICRTIPVGATFGRPFLPQTFCVYQIPKKGRPQVVLFHIYSPERVFFIAMCGQYSSL